MLCKECGTELAEGSAFCHQCGRNLNESAPAKEEAAIDRFKSAVSDRQQDDDGPEEDLWAGTYSKWAMLGWGLIAVAVTLVLIIVAFVVPVTWPVMIGVIVIMWLALGLQLVYRQLSVHYYLTNQRFLHEKGILWRTTDRIEVIDIDDVTFQQGPVERLLGVGTIHITSSDRTHPELVLPGIENCRDVATQIDDLRRQERRSRGLHIESV